MRSIKNQVLAIIVLFTMIISASFGVMSYINAKNAITAEVEEAVQLMATESVKLVASRIETQFIFLESVSQNEFFTIQAKLNHLKNEADRMGYRVLGFTDMRGGAIQSDNAALNVSDMEFFKLAKEGKPNVSDVFMDEASGELIFIIAVPIIRDGNITGVLYGERDGNELSEIISEIVFGESGYTYMINGAGTTIAHPNIDLVANFDNTIERAQEDKKLKQLAELSSRMINGETGIGQYSYEGAKKLAGFAPVPGTDWSLAVTANMEEILQGIDSMRNRTVSLALLFVAIGAVGAFLITGYFANPIVNLTTILERFGNYDLTFDENSSALKYLSRKDEIGKITNAIMKMQNAFTGLIKQAVASAEMVGATSEELSASVQEISSNAQNQASNTEEVSSSMEEMTANINVVSDNMQTAADNVSLINKTMMELKDLVTKNTHDLDDINHSIETILRALDGTRTSIQIISDKSKSASQESEGSVALAKEGKENLDKTVNQMNIIQSTILSLSKVIHDLGESASQIGEITDLIKDVAEQTNLLALNASIEAARAGEHGKGFAVVAQAIGNLADQSQSATKEITNVIKNIQTEIVKAVKNSEEGTMVVESGTILVQETSSSLDKIFKSIQATSDVIQDITAQMDVQLKDTNEVFLSVNDINEKVNSLMAAMEEEMASSEEINNKHDSINQLINEISLSMEQQSAATEQVSSAVNDNAAGIEEISAGTEEIARSAQELAGSAQELVEQVQRFKV